MVNRLINIMDQVIHVDTGIVGVVMGFKNDYDEPFKHDEQTMIETNYGKEFKAPTVTFRRI